MGATNKRIYFFMSAILRALTFVALIIAYIVVKIAVRPGIDWLNLLLLLLAIGAVISAVCNLAMCGVTATSYSQNKWLQILVLIFTLCTGGLVSSTFTTMAVCYKPTKEEVAEENLFKVRKK